MNKLALDTSGKSSWAIGGGVMIGLGVGFFLLPISALYFIGSLFAGLGMGLVLAGLIARS